MEVQVIWLIVFNLKLVVFEKHMRNFWIPTIPWYTFTYHLEEVTGNLWHIYGNDAILGIEPSGWKGFVTCGLGVDTSLLSLTPAATGIWTSLAKATSGPKSRGASFGTTLWRHVQRYCSHFLLFMQTMCSEYYFLHRRKFPKTNLSHSSEGLKNGNFPFFSKACRIFVVVALSFLY